MTMLMAGSTNVNGRNPKNNLIEVCPKGNVHCNVHCYMGLCLKAMFHAPDCDRERCGYDWQKTPEAINCCKTKIFLGQQLPATVLLKETEVYYEEWDNKEQGKIRGLKQALRKANKKRRALKKANKKKRKDSKARRTVPQKLNEDLCAAGAIHTDPEVLHKSILKRHNERYPYNSTSDTINDIC